MELILILDHNSTELTKVTPEHIAGLSPRPPQLLGIHFGLMNSSLEKINGQPIFHLLDVSKISIVRVHGEFPSEHARENFCGRCAAQRRSLSRGPAGILYRVDRINRQNTSAGSSCQ